MAKKKSHPKAAQKNRKAYFADLSAAAQRARLLDALRCSPITTIEARRRLIQQSAVAAPATYANIRDNHHPLRATSDRMKAVELNG